MMRIQPLALLLASFGAVTGCRTGTNYAGLDGPRHAGSTAAGDDGRARGDTLRIVTFNIEFSRRVAEAIALLTGERVLRGADVVLLQEMDADGTRRIAEALGMAYVYYPAIVHHRERRDFGNAVLSRWPIVADAKLVLPHPSRYAGTHRTATAATLRIGDAHVRVYSTHLGTPLDVSGGARRAQLRAILDDAARYPRVVLGGDMNSGSVGRLASEMGYAWVTERGPRTMSIGRWDHIFLKGLATPADSATGTLASSGGASDHRPVWVRAVVW